MNSNPSNSSTPPWLREDLDVAQPLKESSAARPHGEGQSDVDRKSKVIYWILKITTMFLCVLIAATAVIGIGKLTYNLSQNPILLTVSKSKIITCRIH